MESKEYDGGLLNDAPNPELLIPVDVDDDDDNGGGLKPWTKGPEFNVDDVDDVVDDVDDDDNELRNFVICLRRWHSFLLASILSHWCFVISTGGWFGGFMLLIIAV